MIRPVRLQLSRRAGFNLQAVSRAANGLPGVSVARPGRHGNPFRVGDKMAHCPEGIDAAEAVAFFRVYVEVLRRTNKLAPFTDAIRGHNLFCWCGANACCHADVWLEVANQ